MDAATSAGISKDQTAWNRLLSFVMDTAIQDEPVRGLKKCKRTARFNKMFFTGIRQMWRLLLHCRRRK